jgi:hypothetical protein
MRACSGFTPMDSDMDAACAQKDTCTAKENRHGHATYGCQLVSMILSCIHMQHLDSRLLCYMASKTAAKTNCYRIADQYHELNTAD